MELIDITEEIKQLRNSTIPRFYEQVEKKYEYLEKDMKATLEKFNVLDKEYAVLKNEIENIKAADIHFVRQKVDDLLKVGVFEAIQGGTAFNRVSWWLYGIVGAAIIGAVLNLIIK